jgi:hypothetical protein
MTSVYNRVALATAMLFVASVLSAATERAIPRSDTDFPSNFKGPDHDPVTKNPRLSNWPGLPERQGGRSYSKIIYTTSGPRERNAESGRR